MNTRNTLCLFVLAMTLAAGPALSAAETKVECWDVFELTLKGPAEGNPFTDVRLSGRFEKDGRVYEPEGFYDGGGVYKVRFMPDSSGKWTYKTRSNRGELNNRTGSFLCSEASGDNHGPVRVEGKFKLAYADGTPHFSVGTTCYAWAHQGNAREEQTLKTLRSAPFNKMRMCVFPKSYSYNKNEPQFYPYRGEPLKDWDFKRFDPAFWRHFEKRVRQLRDMGIESDIIIFHPYDRWGFKGMGHENNLFYLRYLVARLGAFRNVWWSFANEYDLLKWPMEHWDEYMQLVEKIDPYNHLRGIHNCRGWYDHSKPWVTHCSIQSSNFQDAPDFRERYGKPVIYDECRYEGNVPQGWGNISAEQMTKNFWMGSLAGCYVGHGETYKHPQDILWWAKGGVLHGESPARIQFMKDIIEGLPYQGMQPDFESYPEICVFAAEGQCYLIYFTAGKPIEVDLPDGGPYKVDGIDTWEMEMLPLGSASPGKFTFEPPGPGYALRIVRYKPGERIRPQAKASVDRTEGIAPLTVEFSTPWRHECEWDFADGTTASDSKVRHTFEKPGVYPVRLTVTDSEGGSSTAIMNISVDRKSGEPVVRFGFEENNYPDVSIHGGKVPRDSDGSYDFGSGEPFKWIKSGKGPIEELGGARSFTITGWLRTSAMKIGSGGNRILFSLNYNRSGIDLVHHADGRMRLAVNEWPDGIRNDSSAGRVSQGKWVFFAVTYDCGEASESVCWYFGDEDTPARLDRKTGYNNGPVGEAAANLVIGNFNKTLQRAGLDRQFRGKIRGLQIFASRISSRGALSLERIRKAQVER